MTEPCTEAENRAVRWATRAERERSKRIEAEAEVERLRKQLTSYHDAVAAAMRRLTPDEVHPRFTASSTGESQRHRVTDPCPIKDCPVTRKHWHCVSCGEPCEVGDEECGGCWAWSEEDLEMTEGNW